MWYSPKFSPKMIFAIFGLWWFIPPLHTVINWKVFNIITDKCQQKLGVLQTTVHTGWSAPNYSLQTAARTHASSPAEIDSELVSHRRLEIYQWWLVTGTRSYLQDFCRLLTQSPSYLQPIVALLYTDFDVLGFHRTASVQEQTTTDINNCRTSTF